MIIRQADNVWAWTDDDRVQNLLKYRPAGYQHVDSYKKGYWDGWKSLVKSGTGDTNFPWRFPAGLTDYVVQKYPQQVADVRGSSRLRKFQDHGLQVQLIPEQEALIDLAVMAKQGVIQAPTGVGKGRIIGEIIRRLGVRALVVCDKKDLLWQLNKEIFDCIMPVQVGIVGGGNFAPRDVTVATVQTLTSSKWADAAFFKQFDLIIVDEVHHAPSDSMKAVLQLCTAFYRFGLSATAFTGKDNGTFFEVTSFIGPMIGLATTSQAVAAGRIVGADIFMVEGIVPSPNALARNYREEYEQFVVLSFERNTAIVNIANMLEGPTVILVERVEHGELLSNAIGAYFVHGGTPTKLRNDIYLAFKTGNIETLIIGKLGNEALDLPNIQNLIIAGGGKSSHVTIQKVGRALRASPGKTRATVFDFRDYGKYLSAHSTSRLRTYRSEPAYTVNLIDKEELGL